MLFHLTTDDHIRIINEQGPAETDTAGSGDDALKHRAASGPLTAVRLVLGEYRAEHTRSGMK